MKSNRTTFGLLFLLVAITAPPAGTFADGEDEAAGSLKAGFSMTVADRFRIASGGVVITGTIDSGTIVVGDSICIHSREAGAVSLTVTGIESFNKLLEEASAGDRVGLLVTGIELDAISAGDQVTESC